MPGSSAWGCGRRSSDRSLLGFSEGFDAPAGSGAFFVVFVRSRGWVPVGALSAPWPHSSLPGTAPSGTERVSSGSGISGASVDRAETGRRRASEPECAR